ncbi:RNA-dependent RNA polymerase, partial [Persimmon latent virus]
RVELTTVGRDVGSVWSCPPKLNPYPDYTLGRGDNVIRIKDRLSSFIISDILNCAMRAHGVGSSRVVVEVKHHPYNMDHPYDVIMTATPDVRGQDCLVKCQNAVLTAIRKATNSAHLQTCVEDEVLDYMFPDYNRCVTRPSIARAYAGSVAKVLTDIEDNPADKKPTISLALAAILAPEFHGGIGVYINHMTTLCGNWTGLVKAVDLLHARAIMQHHFQDAGKGGAEDSAGIGLAGLVRELFLVYSGCGQTGFFWPDVGQDATSLEEIRTMLSIRIKLSDRWADLLAPVIWAIMLSSRRGGGDAVKAEFPHLASLLNKASEVMKRLGPFELMVKLGSDLHERDMVADPASFDYACRVRRHVSWVCVNIKAAPTRAQAKSIHKLFPPTSATDARHATTRPDALLWHYISGPTCYQDLDPNMRSVASIQARVSAAKTLFRHIPVGTNGTLVSMMLLSALCTSNGDVVMNNYIVNNALVRSGNSQKKLLKACSTFIRKSSCDLTQTKVRAEDVAVLTYFDLGFGRSMNRSDWQEEIDNRGFRKHHIQHPRAPNVSKALVSELKTVAFGDNTLPDPKFEQAIRAKLAGYCRKLVLGKKTKETMARFYRRRNDWMASGSSGGYKSKTMGELINGEGAGPISVDKRVWAEEHDFKHILRYMRSAPKELARASEKYENGKSRAIYGVAPEHYVINTYVTQGMEERLHNIPGLEKGATGVTELGYIKKRCNITANARKECTMLDYADFNVQHSLSCQYILFDEMLKAGVEVGACPDWVKACSWLRDAKLNQESYFPGKSRPVKITQGMFSGTRSTDLINTLLNLAYYEVAADAVSSYGYSSQDVYHVHQGDDVWLSSDNAAWAATLYYVMNAQGFIFQDSKQMFGPSRGEYLRVLYHSEGAVGYLARSLANYLQRPIQNKTDIGGQAWMESISDTCRVMQRRGLSIYGASVVWQDVLGAKGTVHLHERDRAKIKLPLSYIVAPREAGGMGCPPPGHLVQASLLPPAPTDQLSWKADWSALPHRMADDWIEHVSSIAHSLHKVSINAPALRENIKHTTHEPILASHGLARHNKKWKEQWSSYRKTLASPNNVVTYSPTPNLQSMRSSLSTVIPKKGNLIAGGSLDYITKPIDCNTNSPGSAGLLLNFSETINKYVTQSTFKSTSRTSIALGLSKTAAMTFILREAVEYSRANADLVSLATQLIKYGKADWLDLLLAGGSSILTPLAQFMDGKFVNVFGSLLHQILISASVGKEIGSVYEVMATHNNYINKYVQALSDCRYAPQTMLY